MCGSAPLRTKLGNSANARRWALAGLAGSRWAGASYLELKVGLSSCAYLGPERAPGLCSLAGFLEIVRLFRKPQSAVVMTGRGPCRVGQQRSPTAAAEYPTRQNPWARRLTAGPWVAAIEGARLGRPTRSFLLSAPETKGSGVSFRTTLQRGQMERVIRRPRDQGGGRWIPGYAGRRLAPSSFIA